MCKWFPLGFIICLRRAFIICFSFFVRSVFRLKFLLNCLHETIIQLLGIFSSLVSFHFYFISCILRMNALRRHSRARHCMRQTFCSDFLFVAVFFFSSFFTDDSKIYDSFFDDVDARELQSNKFIARIKKRQTVTANARDVRKEPNGEKKHPKEKKNLRFFLWCYRTSANIAKECKICGNINSFKLWTT